MEKSAGPTPFLEEGSHWQPSVKGQCSHHANTIHLYYKTLLRSQVQQWLPFLRGDASTWNQKCARLQSPGWIDGLGLELGSSSIFLPWGAAAS
jgi:hypothetical protein